MTVDDKLNPVEHAVLATLRRYLSEILARSIRSRAQTALGIPDGSLLAAHLPQLVVRLEQSVRLFVDPALQGPLLDELRQIEGPRARPSTESHTITDEEDISRVRLRAREIAREIGASNLGAQRAATIASELARNIVAYAKAGVVELEPSDARPVLTIRALDRGPGIAELPRILDGQYRSRTGLGKGLLGVKKLSIRFDVKTGPSGTRVEAEIEL